MSIKTLADCLRSEISKENNEQIIELLENLCDQTITLKDLKETKVGKPVSKLRKHSDPTISSLAQKLFRTWARIAKPLVKKSAPKPSQSSSSKPSTTQEVDPHSAMASISELTGDPTRDAVRKAIVKALKPKDEVKHSNYKHIAYSIEDSMFALWGTGREYTQKYRDLSWNLRDPKNPELNEALLAGEILPQRFVNMSADELASSKVKLERTKSREWMKQANRSDHNTGASMTDEFKCGKCKQRNCSYYQQQTRGADEPMTTFVTCMTCGNRWKC